MKRDLEHLEQAALFEWAAWKSKQWGCLKLMFAIPNAQKFINASEEAKIRAISKMKAEGLRPGVPDIFLPVPDRFHNNSYCGLFIEMKVKPNKPTKEQMEWIDELAAMGYKAVVCYSFEEAKETICDYLGIEGE